MLRKPNTAVGSRYECYNELAAPPKTFMNSEAGPLPTFLVLVAVVFLIAVIGGAFN